MTTDHTSQLSLLTHSAYLPGSDIVTNVTTFLKSKWTNVTCLEEEFSQAG